MQLQTRIRSTIAGLLTSANFAELSRRIARGKRRLSGKAPVVHYFHQVDDPHSHLAVQKPTSCVSSTPYRLSRT